MGKTKILTVLQIKLPNCDGIDNITVKVDDGAEGNILPLNSFRAMFPHALDTNSYPKPGFLRGSKITLECYDDGKLINHGSIKLRLQHYSEKSFQDHSFYVVETKTPKPIIIGHPVSIRLVFCFCLQPLGWQITALQALLFIIEFYSVLYKFSSSISKSIISHFSSSIQYHKCSLNQIEPKFNSWGSYAVTGTEIKEKEKHQSLSSLDTQWASD